MLPEGFAASEGVVSFGVSCPKVPPPSFQRQVSGDENALSIQGEVAPHPLLRTQRGRRFIELRDVLGFGMFRVSP